VEYGREFRLARNRVEGDTLIGRVVYTVALIGVVELHGQLRLCAIHDDVRKAVDLVAAWRRFTTEVRMQTTGRADERHEAHR